MKRIPVLLGPVGSLVVLIVLTFSIGEQNVTTLAVFITFTGLALSLGLLVGDTGLLSMGHMAFFGIGAYGSTLLVQDASFPLPWAVLVTVVGAAIVAAAVGIPATTRTSGLYFAIVTFAFGMLVVEFVNHQTKLTGGSEGMAVQWGVGSAMPFGWTIYRFFTFWLACTLPLLALVAVLIRRSQFGLRLRALKESEPLTRGIGFNPAIYKSLIFVIASAMAALLGSLYAPLVGFINPSLMGVDQSILILGLAYVGGLRSTWGAAVGVGVLYTAPTYFGLDGTLRTFLVGGVMAIVVLVAPNRGLVGLLRDATGLLSRRRVRQHEKDVVAEPPVLIRGDR